MKTTILQTVDGNKIVVPDDLNLITPYVLCEQRDWFEDEIKFLRQALKPGQQVIDIGANHGVYAMSMARTVGPSGAVWAFEPSSATAELLRQTVELNNFRQVTVTQKALSSKAGVAHLTMSVQSELNALTTADSANGATEKVIVTTLDESAELYKWETIDFVKIDAEGEEFNIIEGGTRFFEDQSPLVQFEIKNVSSDLSAIFKLKELNFEIYKLIPSLNLLIAIDNYEEIDGYQLNLFAAKKDRASELALDGLLIVKEGVKLIKDKINNEFDSKLKNATASVVFNEGINFYKNIAVEKNTIKEKLHNLILANECFKLISKNYKKPEYISSFVRTSLDLGDRTLGIKLLDDLIRLLIESDMSVSDYCIFPLNRFEKLSDGKDKRNLLLAAALECYEKMETFSSFYGDESSLKRLEMISSLGFLNDELNRRWTLLKHKHRLQS